MRSTSSHTPSLGMRVFFVDEYWMGTWVRLHVENWKLLNSDTKPVVIKTFANSDPIHFLLPWKEKENQTNEMLIL